MPTPLEIQQAIESVTDQETFIQKLLIATLEWQIPGSIEDIEDITYKWEQDDLRAKGLDEHLVGGSVLQLMKMTKDQEWGIFILEFNNPDVFISNRGLTSPLRKTLRGLVPHKRASTRRANLPAWERENLLFICTYNYEHFRFVYFKAPKGKEKTAPLALFGWNKGDTDIRTLCEHNLPFLKWDEDDPNMTEWRNAFSIEKVSTNFYRSYADVFKQVEKAIGDNNEIKDEELRLFTQTLFNRLMFLKFVEKKGWLQFQESTDYLASIYAAGGIGSQTFYRSRLMPLFFEALAVEGMQELEAIGRVPFLNGGLFEKKEGLDDKVNDIPNDAFVPILGSEGLFNRYNFTVEESTPLDIEVAVDPEMLGRVFEKLVTGRHESGSYYTPRPVVAFMCREAIKAYLVEKTGIDKTAIAKLVDENDIKEMPLKEGEADEILYYLKTIRAIDPACGSGAYLLGLLQELVIIRRTLQNDNFISDPAFLYKLKRSMITKCLYGVDIDKFATNIAKLRLWLSLAVESAIPQSLPNLDFKIETGDSVLGPCEKTLGPIFEKEAVELSKQIADLKEDHEDAHENKKESFQKVQEKIDYLKGFISIKSSKKKAIVWLADFAEVFAKGRRKLVIEEGKEGEMVKTTVLEPGGFDIVLANPPYIRQELIKDDKPKLQDIYKDTFTGTADLYTYFYTRAIELLAPGGVLSFISSNKWFRAAYGKKLRGYIARKCYVHSITDFGELPVFKTAATFPMIFVAQKSDSRGETTFTQVKNLEPPYPDVKAIIEQNGSSLPADAIEGDSWNLTDAETLKILRKMEAAGVPLKEYVNGEIYYGIKTGFNKAFVIDGKRREELIAEDPASEDLIKPMAKGDDVRKWHIRDKDRWMIITSIGVDIDKYPAVYKHLKRWKKELQARQDQGNHWWELRACSYYNIFEIPKIHYPEIARDPRFSFDDTGIYPLKTVFTIPSSDLYLLGILNSNPAWKYLKRVCSVLGDADKGGRLTLQTIFVEQLPIPTASSKEKKAIEILAQKCLDAEGKNCEKWEAQIDKIVTKLYGLEE